MIRTAYIPIEQIDIGANRAEFDAFLSWTLKVETAQGDPDLLDRLVEEANRLPITLVQIGPARYRLVDGLLKILVLRDLLTCSTMLAEIVETNDTQSAWRNQQ